MVWLYGKGVISRELAMSTAPATYDTHHGYHTFIHGMTAHGFNTNWSARRMQTTIAEWIIDQYTQALAALKAANGNDNDPVMRTAGFEIGKALHTIEDLYVPAHVERSNPTGPILRFQDYEEQDPDAHDEDDKTNAVTEAYIAEATAQCTTILRFLKARANPATVGAWLVGPGGPLALAEGAINGGTAKKYVKKPTRPEEPWRPRGPHAAWLR